ncbi:YciI family protein [Frondihabitans cladoniiphilus]|uniref:YCII-related domain-containing protein n=1 Tax=Frondihabitans cladoniiphilus TaxID=715785 RepID=A0ABP8WBC5_9MICO
MTIYTVTYTYDENRADDRAGLLPEHRAWLTGKKDDGALIEAGVYTDSAMALLLFRFDSILTAERELDADPFAVAGLITSRVLHAWKPGWGPVAALAEA